MPKIIPCLWFDDEAEEAAKFYVSIFKRSRILRVARYGEAGAKASGRPRGSIMTVDFRIEGQAFVALNGGPVFKFSPAISFMTTCKTQAELDRLWKKLSHGGEIQQCGWLMDKYGVSWQIVPAVLGRMIHDKDLRRSERVMAALMGMRKLDIAALKKAHGTGPR